MLVAVKAAGVGPWDRLVREGQSGLGQALPLTLGSDISGRVAALGAGIDVFALGEAVYGATNDRFVGGYAEYALVEAGKVAREPAALDYITAAGLPVVAVTAWQMLFEYARIELGQVILVRGAAGSVGAYATQMATEAGASVYGTARPRDIERVRALGAEPVVEGDPVGAQLASRSLEAIIDTIGGDALESTCRRCARTASLFPLCGPQTRPISGRAAYARRISSSTSRATNSTGYRRWSYAERLTCRSARFSTLQMLKSPTACWMARPTSPEKSCSRSQTDRGGGNRGWRMSAFGASRSLRSVAAKVA